MRKLHVRLHVAMTIALLTFPLLASSQNGTLPNVQWNATKVFDLGLEQVYNLYIDTLGLNDVETVICFQTKDGKLIKTDFNGNILRTEDNPYTYFTCYKGDTLIIKGNSFVNEKGDTLKFRKDNGNVFTSYITATQSSVYFYDKAKVPELFVMGFIGCYKGSFENASSFDTGIRDDESKFLGMCCSEGLLFDVIITAEAKSIIEYWKESDSDSRVRSVIPVNNPAGIGAYGDFLYVYSNTDKALYRLETPDGIGISALITEPEEEPEDEPEEEDDEEEDYLDTIYPLNMDFIPAPNKMFVKKVPGVTNDYIVSLLDEQLNDKYHITGWYGDFCKVDVVEDSLIDGAITELLKSDSVAITRRILYFRPDYEFFIEHGYPIDEYCEICIFSDITYCIRKKYTQDTVDSLANLYGLKRTTDQYEPKRLGSLAVPKTADIFDIAQKLYDTQCFTYISLSMYMRVKLSDTTPIGEIETEQVEILDTQYYNLSGQRINTPSGLTIVVTRYSDGSVHTEKRLF